MRYKAVVSTILSLNTLRPEGTGVNVKKQDGRGSDLVAASKTPF